MKRFRSMISLMVILAMCFSFVSFTSCSVIEDLMGGNKKSSRDKDDDEDEDEDEEEEEEETETSETEETSETSESRRLPDETEATDAPAPSVTVSGSGDHPQVACSYQYTYDDSPYSAGYYLLELTEDSKAAYPALDQSLSSFNDQAQTDAETIVQSKSLFRSFYMKRADSAFFSGVQTEKNDYYSESTLCGINFNVQTGEQVLIGDIIADEASFCQTMTDRGCPISSFADFDSGDVSFFIENDGITVIAPDGSYYKTLYIGNEYLFTDAFVPGGDDYYCQYGELFEDNDVVSIYTDMGGDGLLDSLEITYEGDEYGNTTAVDINVNGNTASITDIYGYGGYVDLLSVDGGYYLFVLVNSDNDYNTTYAFDISSDSPVLLNEFQGKVTGGPIELVNTYMSQYYPSDTVIEDCIPTDPHGLYICQRTHLFSSYNVLYPAEFITDAEDDDLNGIFDLNGSFGYATGGQILTTLMDVDTISYPDGQSATIPSGTDLKIVLAYGYSNTAIVEDIESGQQYYLTYDNNDYPRTINGVNEEDVLSGIMYAG